MLNNIFKLLFLLVGIFIAIILVAMYQKLDNGRYQVAVQTGHTVILDTKTGIVYEYDGNGGYVTHNNGKQLNLARLPE